jgi:uncharacterized protein YbjT (DUF2867 family)
MRIAVAGGTGLTGRQTVEVLRRAGHEAVVIARATGLDVSFVTQLITLAHLPALAGAVVMNSWTPGIAVNRINAVPFPEAPSFLELLHQAYRAEPLTSP